MKSDNPFLFSLCPFFGCAGIELRVIFDSAGTSGTFKLVDLMTPMYQTLVTSARSSKTS